MEGMKDTFLSRTWGQEKRQCMQIITHELSCEHRRKPFVTTSVIKHFGQVAQRSCEYHISCGIQGQVEWGFRQPVVVAGVPAHGRGLELNDLQGSLQPKPFYDTVFCKTV